MSKYCNYINCQRVAVWSFNPYLDTYYRYCEYHADKYQKDIEQAEIDFKRRMVDWIRRSDIKNLKSLHNAVEGEIRLRHNLDKLCL